MFSRIGKAALKPDLSNTIKMCAALGDPQNKFKSVHIAGTNGKGSTSHALAAVFQKAGYKTGLYTSPHLVDFRERIRINGIPVSEQWVVEFVARHKQLIEETSPSFFEITVAMAFDAFAEAGLDIAVIETGLGGRLDSTNVITPLLSIITNISYDHKDLLGDTLAAISAEKAGIMKPGVPVIIGEQHDETERVFFERSVHQNSPLYYAESHWEMVRTGQTATQQHYKAVNKADYKMYDVYTDLTGNYQQHNIKTVLTAVQLLQASNFNITIEGAIDALAAVKSATGLMGRWDVLQQRPFIICDVAHNTAGLSGVFAQWQLVPGVKKAVVAGFVRDKDVAEALALFPIDADYYFCNAAIPRALPVAELMVMAAEAGLNGQGYPSVAEAVDAARAAMSPDDALLITGSFFIVGEALEAMKMVEITMT
ncbi:MAG: bifunctional folylpolyglutamate synthase/dihydrofolate synthase [Taibaiella sp.]|nr:bifunctional folylpolyglutamate synthase/dihydrofolate synthase [Taibaiella sp.]